MGDNDAMGRRQDTFGLREIGLTLSTEQGDAQSMMFTNDGSVDLVAAPLGVHSARDVKGAGSRTDIGRKLVTRTKKVTRYFPGQAPKWMSKEATSSSKSAEGVVAFEGAVERRKKKGGARVVAEAKIISKIEKVVEEQREPVVLREDPLPRHARVKAAPVVLASEKKKKQDKEPDKEKEESESSSSDESSCEGDVVAAAAPVEEDDVAARRARVRAKLKARAAEQEVAAAEVKPEVAKQEDTEISPFIKPPAADESSASSEYESGSESESEEESDEEAAARPVFVPKSERATIDQQRERERIERVRKEKEKQRRKDRAAESRALVADVVMRAATEETKKHFGQGGKDEEPDSDWDAPDDDDDLDDPLEFEAWRVRELGRAHRERDERASAAADLMETERRRALTPAERSREDKEMGKGAKPEKAKWKFLQKYHHKGAFFMDDDTLKKAGDDDVRTRDTDGAVLGDKFDKQAMPSVLQVKDFGFQGRTKYTHLNDQDTTFIDRDNPMNGWTQRKSGDALRSKYDQKMGGVGDLDAAFQKRRQTRK